MAVSWYAVDKLVICTTTALYTLDVNTSTGHGHTLTHLIDLTLLVSHPSLGKPVSSLTRLMKNEFEWTLSVSQDNDSILVAYRGKYIFMYYIHRL